jgi:hypothetical protein
MHSYLNKKGTDLFFTHPARLGRLILPSITGLSDHLLLDAVKLLIAYLGRGFATRNVCCLPWVARNHEIRDVESGRVIS